MEAIQIWLKPGLWRRMGPVAITLALLGAFHGPTASVAQPVQTSNPLANPNFEVTDQDGGVAGWSRGGGPNYQISLEADAPHSGSLSLRLERAAEAGGSFGAVSQAIEAAPFRGKTIRFRAALRSTPDSGGAGLWVRIERRGGRLGFFDNMGDRRVRSAEWETFEITGPVALDATRITLGALLQGSGTAWIDTASIEVLGDASAGHIPAAPLQDEALLSVSAFAKLYGYVRWFYPTLGATEADWNQIAMSGVERLEGAIGPEDLARRLQHFFRPVAPDIRVWVTEEPPPPAPDLGEEGALMRWRHTGVSLGRPGIYRSELVATEPIDEWIQDLPGGVTAAIPLSVAAIRPQFDNYELAKPDSYLPSGDDRTTRLAGTIIAWNIFKHFFPYFDDQGESWEQMLPSALTAAAMDRDSVAYQRSLEQLVARLKDGHGQVHHELQTHGLPLSWELIEGELVITAVASTAPTTLQVGDIVRAIDGVPAGDAIAAEASLVSAATPQWRAHQAANRLSRGYAGESVSLDVMTRSGDRETVAVERSLRLGVPLLNEPRPEALEEIRDGVWYVDLTRLDDARLQNAWTDLSEGRAVIFDLRGYPRGVTAEFLGRLSDAPISAPPMNLPVVSRPDGEGWDWHQTGWSIDPVAPRVRGQVIFLTDGRAISYAETLLSMINAFDLGEIVGSTTAGTNGNINPFSLPGGYGIVWTGMQVLRHDGSAHHGVGIAPDVRASRTIAGVRDGRDEVLDTALSLTENQTLLRRRRAVDDLQAEVIHP